MSKARQALVMATVMLVSGGCGGSPDSARPNIYVLGVDQLDEPEVEAAGVYRPRFTFDVGDVKVAGMFVTLAAARPETLAVRAMRADRPAAEDLDRVSAPADATALREDRTGWSLPPEARDRLAAGHGVFWVVPVTGAGVRVAIAAPVDSIGPLGTLVFFTHTAPDGAPLGAARIELAASFYYMASVGDSAMWGNGLRESDKFRTLVADRVQTVTTRRVINQVYAVNGSGILPAENTYPCTGLCAGEVPKGMISIPEQVDLIERPELIELVLVDGCANDVGLSNILSAEVDPEDLAAMTRSLCGGPMRALLEQIAETMPRAAVVVTGYFPVLSAESDFADLEEFLTIIGVPVFAEDLAELLDALVPNAEAFLETSNAELRASVDAVNTLLGETRIAFASPDFGPSNATFGPDAWLWGLTSRGNLAILSNVDIGLRLFPEDPLADVRVSACSRDGAWHDPVSCLYTSLAHPNTAGARAFFEAIVPQLELLGVLPATE